MSAESLSDLTVLVVDDQAESRMQLRSMLEDLGLSQIYEAGDGRTGIQFILSANTYMDLILCDWNMPMMSGIDLLQTMRKNGLKIPFLMITGRGDNDSVVEAKACGVDGFIRKPYTPVQMEAKIRAVMSRARAA